MSVSWRCTIASATRRPIEPSPSCPYSIVNVFPRMVDVQVAGPARIRVHGRREPGGTSVVFATIQVR